MSTIKKVTKRIASLRIQIGKEEDILSMFADNLVLYLKDPKTPGAGGSQV
jgi:hypothetical protein